MTKLSLQSGESFGEFNQRFYSKFPDLTVFDAGDINLVKVVLDGLKVNYQEKGPFDPFWFRKVFSVKLFWKRANTPSRRVIINSPRVLIVDDGRAWKDQQGNSRSAYFHHIINGLKKEGVPTLVIQKSREKLETSDVMLSDYRYLEFWALNGTQRKFLTDLRRWEKSFTKNLHPHDAMNVRCALHKFFGECVMWYKFLWAVKPEILWFICHYHNEGMIWAARKLDVKVCELQHGLISKSDIFYCMPPEVAEVRSRILMPDFMRTYGTYWSELLKTFGHEFAPEQIGELGYYLSDVAENPDDELLEIKKNKSEVFLLTTQTKLSNYFLEYVKAILPLLETRNACILIKPHPNEPEERYNKVKDNHSVFVFKHKSLSALFSVCDAHISIYSTTLFDALRFGVSNQYCLDVEERSDYTKEMVEAGVATLLNLQSLPALNSETTKIEASRFFSNFSFNVTDFVEPK